MVVFINDVLIYSPIHKDYVRHLTIILQTLCEHQLYAKLEKCEF